MAEPTFLAWPLVATETRPEGEFRVSVLFPPKHGWRQAGVHRVFAPRVEAMEAAARLVVECEAGTANDYATATASPFDLATLGAKGKRS